MNSNIKKRAVAASVMVASSLAVLALALSMQALPLQSSADKMDKIESNGQGVSVGFFFNICGDNGQSNVAGTPEHPLKLKKGDKPTAIELCARSTDNTFKSWEISATDINLGGPPPNGINVSFDKKSLDLPAYAGNIEDFGTGKGNTDNFKVFVSADDNTLSGEQAFVIKAKHLAQEGYYEVLAQAVYFSVN